jgi:hypothetical protein
MASGGGSFGGDTGAATAAENRRFQMAMSESKQQAADAEAQASLAAAKAKAAETQAMETAQKEAIQAMEQAAAKEVEVTEVAGSPDVQEIVMDRPTVEGMGYMQIPEDEEEETQGRGPRSSGPSVRGA